MNIFSRIKSAFGGHLRSFSLPWSTESNVMSKREALNQYRRYIYTIVSAIAGDVAKINFQVFKSVTDRSGKVKRVLQPNHAFIKLMRKPNPDYTKFSFVEMHELYMELCGESFWYKVRGENTQKIKYLTLLRPDMMTVATGSTDKNPNPLGFVVGYVLTKVDGTKVPFESNEIIHIKTPNPADPTRGLSPIEAAVEYVKTERLTSEFTMNSINNSGRPSGVLNVKGNIGKEEFEQIKKRFKQEYSGTNNAGKTMLINGTETSGVDFVKLGMEIGEVALKDFKEISRDDLMMMFRVSKTMLGITDDVNRASAKEAKSVWIENVIKPKMERLCDSLDSTVSDEYGLEDDLDFEDPSPKYLEDRTAEWTAGHNKWLRTNDIIRERNEFMGTEIKEVEGGDEIYQSIALVPVGDKPKETTSPKDDGGKKSLTVKKKELSRKEFGAIFRTEFFSHQKLWQTKYQESLNKILEEQKKEILSRNKKVFEEWTFDPKQYKEKYRKLFVELGTELMKEQALIALNAAGDTETIFEVSKRILDYINNRVELFAGEFDNETINYIKTSIAEGIQGGESITKLRKRIDGVYQEAESVRSERVARTETIASSNEAALEAYRQSPVVSGQEWTTEDGACEFCLAMDGKIVGLETNFASVGETIDAVDLKGNPISYIVDYADITHPPLHPNCQCSILPVSADSMVKILKSKSKK